MLSEKQYKSNTVVEIMGMNLYLCFIGITSNSAFRFDALILAIACSYIIFRAPQFSNLRFRESSHLTAEEVWSEMEIMSSSGKIFHILS